MGKDRKCAVGCLTASSLVALLLVALVMKTIPSSSSPGFSAKHVLLEASRGSQAVSLLVDVERQEQPGAWHSVNLGEGECKLLTPCHAGGQQRCAILRGMVLPVQFGEDGSGQVTVYLTDSDPVHLWDIARNQGAGIGLSCELEAQLDLFKLGFGLGPKRTVNFVLELGDDVATLPRVRLERHSFQASRDKNLTLLAEGSYTLHVTYASTSGMANLLSSVPIEVHADVDASEHRALNGTLSVHGDLRSMRDEAADEILLSLPFEVKGSACPKTALKAIAARGKLVPELLKFNHTKSSMSTTVRRLASTTMTAELQDMLPEEGSEESWDLGFLDETFGEMHANMNDGVLVLTGNLTEGMGEFDASVSLDATNDRLYLAGNVTLFGMNILVVDIETDTSVEMDLVDTAVMQLAPGLDISELLNITGRMTFENTLADGDLMVKLTMEEQPESLQVSIVGESGGTDILFEMLNGTDTDGEIKASFRPDGESWNFGVSSLNMGDMGADISFISKAAGFDFTSSVAAGGSEVIALNLSSSTTDDLPSFHASISLDGFSGDVALMQNSTMSDFSLSVDIDDMLDLDAMLVVYEVNYGSNIMLQVTEGAESNSLLNVDATWRDVDGDITFSVDIGGFVVLEADLGLTQVDTGFDLEFETTIGENETTNLGVAAKYRSADGGFDLLSALRLEGREEAAFNLSNLEANGNSSWSGRFRGMGTETGMDIVFTNDIPSDGFFRTDVALLMGSDFSSAGAMAFRASTLDGMLTMSEMQEGRKQLLMQQPFELLFGLKGPEGEEEVGFIVAIGQKASIVSVDVQFIIAGSGGIAWSTSCDSSTGTSMVLASDVLVLDAQDPAATCVDFKQSWTFQSFTCGESMMDAKGTLAHGGTDFSTGVLTLSMQMEDNETMKMYTEEMDVFMNVSRGFLVASSMGGHDAMWLGMSMEVDGEVMNMSDFAFVMPSDGGMFMEQGRSAVNPLAKAPPAADEAVVVTGKLKLTVPDAEAFCANQDALDSVATALYSVAKADGGPSFDADDVLVSCADDDRRLSAERRLNEALTLKYSIVIEVTPDGNSAAPSVDQVASIASATRAAIAELEVEELEEMVNQELVDRGVDIVITVEEIEAPAVEVVDKSEVGFETTTTSVDRTQTDDAAPLRRLCGGSALALAAALLAAAPLGAGQ